MQVWYNCRWGIRLAAGHDLLDWGLGHARREEVPQNGAGPLLPGQGCGVLCPVPCLLGLCQGRPPAQED